LAGIHDDPEEGQVFEQALEVDPFQPSFDLLKPSHGRSKAGRVGRGKEQAFIGGSGFSIGRTLTHTASGHGFLNLYANDVMGAYADNSGSIAVTIKRIE
jgi:hypothetical protein